MAWTNEGDALHLENPLNPGAVDSITSTSTVLCYDEAMSAYFLRMFGILPGQVAGLGPESAVQGPAPTDPGSVVQGDWLNVAFIESARAPAGSDWATALSFDLQQWNGVTSYPLRSTVVPVTKSGLKIEGETGQYAFYKDVHVVQLPGDAGRLMLLVRNSGVETLGPGYEHPVDPTEDNCSTAIVGYWAPDDDPTFTSANVKGPYWLVDRIQALYEADGAPQAALWLGVPAGIVQLEGDGTYWLFIYYTAEVDGYAPVRQNQLPLEFLRGTRLRKIRMSTLAAIIGFPWSDDAGEPNPGEGGWNEHPDWPAAEPSASGPEGGSDLSDLLGSSEWAAHRLLHEPDAPKSGERGRTAEEADDESEWTDETQWSSENETGLVSGWDCGRVRIWVATGKRFHAGADPAEDDLGNTQIEETYRAFRVNDAVPVGCPSGLVLFFCGNIYAEDELEVDHSGGGPPAWGLWRATALPRDTAPTFGLDFVVHDGAPDNAGERDYIVHSKDGLDLQVDPDPVRMIDGSWLVFSGQTSGEPLQRFAGEPNNGCHPADDAWD